MLRSVCLAFCGWLGEYSYRDPRAGMPKIRWYWFLCSISMYRSFQCMSGSKRTRNGYPRMISPVDGVTCRLQRMVRSPMRRYNRTKWVIGRTSPEATRTDSGHFNLCREQFRRLIKEWEIKLPPAPESMSAEVWWPSTSRGIVSKGATRSTGHN